MEMVFGDFIKTYDDTFYLFISQNGEEYSGSYAYDMYRKYYDVSFPMGSKFFDVPGGYLEAFRVQPRPEMKQYWTIDSLDYIYSQYTSLNNLKVSVYADGVVVYTENDEQTDSVEKCIRSLSKACFHSGKDDVEKWLWKFIDRKELQSARGVKLNDFCEHLNVAPTVLVDAINLLDGFNWNNRDEVYVWLDTNFGRFNLSIRDDSVGDSTNEDAYVKEIQNYFGSNAEVQFKPYSNGYWQSCPNPSNFSFDHPGLIWIRYKAELDGSITSGYNRMIKSTGNKELSGKSKDDFIKKAMKSQGYTEQEADAMVNQSKVNCIPGTNIIESSEDKMMRELLIEKR